MATHAAIRMVGQRQPLELAQVPTVEPGDGEALVKVEWVCSTPLDLHQADGGIATVYPGIVSDGIAGEIVKLGSIVTSLKVGDKVFGFGWRSQKERAGQEYATYHQNLLGKIPNGFTYQEAVTLPNNFVTVFHTLTADLDIPLPWPRPEQAPSRASDPILIWGASSSVGIYAIQILKYYGYTNVIGTASRAHHAELKSFGARAVFDYRDPDIVSHVLAAGNTSQAPAIPLILDCIGSKSGSVEPISKIAQAGSTVAVLLPVIVRDATVEEAPIYAMDAQGEADWAEGVTVRSVRTHLYLQNEFFATHLQPVIMPYMLEHGIVKPNRQRIVHGKTFRDRAQNALDILRRKEVSGERLVWKVFDDGEE